MKKHTKVVIAALLSVLMMTGMLVPGASALEPTEAQVVEYSQQNESMTGFLNDFTYPSYDNGVSYLLDYAKDRKDSLALGYRVTIPEGGSVTLTDGENQRTVKAKGGQTLYNLTPGRVSSYRINRSDGTIKEQGLLKPTGQLRVINCSFARNVRDLGGWACDGGTVKYGKLFRGGEIYTPEKEQTDGEITTTAPDLSDVYLLRDLLGVRAELCLLWDEDAWRTESVLGYRDTVDFLRVCGPWYSIYGDQSNDHNWSDDAFYDILNYVMDNVIDGKPLYFHCAAGADRTGTVAYVLEALLGMSQSDMDKDYELTTFYTEYGVNQKPASRRRLRNEAEWINYMNQFNAFRGETRRDQVVNWALSIGISMDKINAFRAAMIDGNPEVLTNDEWQPLLGDANGSGEINILDATVIKRNCAELTTGIRTDDLMLGDVDGDGIVDIPDATFIQRWLVQMPVPYPIGTVINL